MTILVTGGAGYIGSHMVLDLLDHGFDVVVLDNLSTGHKGAIHQNAHFFRGDISDDEIIDKICDQFDILAAFHFAGSSSVPESIENPVLYSRNNTDGTRSLAESLVRNEVRILVFSSSAAVYGVSDTSPVSESAQCCPTSPYGWSKLASEQVLQDASDAHEFKIAVLRYFNVAGADPSGRAGQLALDAQSLVKVACEVATGKREFLDIFGRDYNTPDGTCIRDYIHVSDLVHAHRLAMEALLSNGENILCNLGYGNGTSVLQIANAVGNAAGKTLPLKFGSRRTGDLASVIANSERAKRTLGWQPAFYDINYIVKTAYDWEIALGR